MNTTEKIYQIMSYHRLLAVPIFVTFIAMLVQMLWLLGELIHNGEHRAYGVNVLAMRIDQAGVISVVIGLVAMIIAIVRR